MKMNENLQQGVCLEPLKEKADRDLVICGEINKEVYLYLLDAINKINKEDEIIFQANEQLKDEYKIAYEPITIVINSGGGNVSDGMAIMDLLDRCYAPVHTHVEGMCCSMAIYVYLKGAIRTAGKLSEFGIHGSLGACFGYIGETKKILESVDRQEEKLNQFLLEKTKFTKEEIDETQNCLHFYDYDMAVEKGLVNQDIYSLLGE